MPYQSMFSRKVNASPVREDMSAPQPLQEEPDRDARGHYGYGRPAHGSDPRATYSFGRRSSF